MVILSKEQTSPIYLSPHGPVLFFVPPAVRSFKGALGLMMQFPKRPVIGDKETQQPLGERSRHRPTSRQGFPGFQPSRDTAADAQLSGWDTHTVAF